MAKVCECCGQPLKVAKFKRSGARKCIWPAPVYEAHMSDGEVIRMSFYSQVGKPLDMDRARRLILQCTGRPTRIVDQLRQRAGTWKAPTIVQGGAHHDGNYYLDESTVASFTKAA